MKEVVNGKYVDGRSFQKDLEEFLSDLKDDIARKYRQCGVVCITVDGDIFSRGKRFDRSLYSTEAGQ